MRRGSRTLMAGVAAVTLAAALAGAVNVGLVRATGTPVGPGSLRGGRLEGPLVSLPAPSPTPEGRPPRPKAAQPRSWMRVPVSSISPGPIAPAPVRSEEPDESEPEEDD